MKRETRANKLNELLGITEKVVEVTTKYSGKIIGVSEEEIQEFREIQGVLYFLQAPALFTDKICKHCGEPYLVSRKYVAFCSYTCIQKELAKNGIKWRKGQDLEALANDPQVYDGNEPLWIRKKCLEKLQTILTSISQDSTTLSTATTFPQGELTSSPSEVPTTALPSLSDLFPTLPATTSTVTTKQSSKNGKRRKIISTD